MRRYKGWSFVVVYVGRMSYELVADLPELYQYEAIKDKIINAAPTIQEVSIAVRSSTCAPTRPEMMTAAPSTTFTNSAKVEDAVLPAHTAAAKTRTPNVTNRPTGAPGIHSGADAK